MFFAVDGDFGDGDRACDMKLTRAKRAFLGVFAFDGIEKDFMELYGISVPVRRALSAAYVLVWLPVGQREVAVADQIAGARPSGPALVPCAEFFNRCAVKRIPRRVTQHRR